MWQSRTKKDLMIEVWEKLDCESVGASEIEAIEEAVSARFGQDAVESPMSIARLLADEGAVLRHSEIMSLWVERYSEEIAEDALTARLIRLESFDEAAKTLQSVENLRRKYKADADRESEKNLRNGLLDAKKELLRSAKDRKLDEQTRRTKAEIAEWVTIWLQSPELFENWIGLRTGSTEFRKLFGEVNIHG
jgi:hypothetical protein